MKTLRLVLVFLSAALSLTLLNFLQVLSCVSLGFGLKRFFSFQRLLVRGTWVPAVYAMRALSKTDFQVTGDWVPFNERALVLSNHRQMVDILAMSSWALDRGMLVDVKWYAKKFFKYFPGIGWGMHFLACIFLSRNYSKDHRLILKMFSRLRRWPAGFWLVSFSEGTRFSAEKLKKAQAFGLAQGLPPVNQVLYPRPKGFLATLEGLEGCLDAIYDVTLIYPGNRAPRLRDFARGELPWVRIQVKRFSLSELPPSREGRTLWLYERFFEKDVLLSKNADEAVVSDSD